MSFRKINRIIHRDLGYFFFGMVIIYALSGIALNHLNDWNPSYKTIRKNVAINYAIPSNDFNKDDAIEILSEFNLERKYIKHQVVEDGKIKITLQGGSMYIDKDLQKGELNYIKKRPVFYQLNFLHYNPRKLWTFFSDFFSIGLILLALTGLFLVKGKKGITGRGAIWVIAGIIIPVVLLILYL